MPAFSRPLVEPVAALFMQQPDSRRRPYCSLRATNKPVRAPVNRPRSNRSGDKKGPHPRNSFKGSYDMETLCRSYSPLNSHIVQPNENSNSRRILRPTINFADPDAVRALNTALLVSDYGIAPSYADILPGDALVPPVPGRADYIHYIADIIAEASGGRGNGSIIPEGSSVRGLDIGTGASVIYPLLANSAYGWSMVGSEVNAPSIKSARAIVEANELQQLIDVRLQKSIKSIFDGIWRPNEHMDFVMCNPPFFASLEGFQEENARKVRGLARGGANKRSRGVVAISQESNRARQPSSNNFGGTASELWCDGGEVSFVKGMVKESKRYTGRCLWFTSLVSRNDNLEKIERQLLKNSGTGLNVAEIRKMSMGAGAKSASIIMWTYMNERKRQEWASKRGWG